MSLWDGLGLVALSLALAMAAGAAMGMKLGAEPLGWELAALVGAFFGPMPVLPAVVLGLLALAVLR